MFDSDMYSVDEPASRVSKHTDPLLRGNTVFACRVFKYTGQQNSSIEWLNSYGTSHMTIAGGLGVLGSLVGA